MSALTQTHPKQMENNKREAPADLRSNFIKKQKNMAKKWTSVDVPNATSPTKPTEQLTNLPSVLTTMETEISMIKRRNGEYIPKIHLKDDSRKKNLEFLLPKMVVKYQNLGKDGNLGKFTKDPKKARLSVCLEVGCPEELRGLMPSLEDEQKEFFTLLTDKCKQHMEMVYHHDDPSWSNSRGELELEDFVSKANFSCIKTVKDDNDDDYEVISLARRLTDFQGAPNNPVFWKVNEKNEFQ